MFSIHLSVTFTIPHRLLLFATSVFELCHSCLQIAGRLIWLLGRLLATLLNCVGGALDVFYTEFAHFGRDLYDAAELVIHILAAGLQRLFDLLCFGAECWHELLTTGRLQLDRLPSRWQLALLNARDSTLQLIQTLGQSVWLLVTLPANLLGYAGRAVCVLSCSLASSVTGFCAQIGPEAMLGLAILLLLFAGRRKLTPLAGKAGGWLLRWLLIPAGRAGLRWAEQQARVIGQLGLDVGATLAAAARRWSLSRLFGWWTLAEMRPPQRAIANGRWPAIRTPAATPTPQTDGQMCVICTDQPKTMVLLPCRHMCLCERCSRDLLQFYDSNCPMCRQLVEQSMRVYA